MKVVKRPRKPADPEYTRTLEAGKKHETHKLTVYIPRDLFRSVKMKALGQNTTLSDLFTKFANDYARKDA